MSPPSPIGQYPHQQAPYSAVAARSQASTPSDRSTGFAHIDEVRQTIHQLEQMQQQHEEELNREALTSEVEESLKPTEETAEDDTYSSSEVYTQLTPRPHKRQGSTASAEIKQEEDIDNEMTDVDDELTDHYSETDREDHDLDENVEELLQQSYPSIETTSPHAESNRSIRNHMQASIAGSSPGERSFRFTAPSPEPFVRTAEETASSRGLFSGMMMEAEENLIQNPPLSDEDNSPRWQPRRQMTLQEMTHAETWQYQNWLMIELANVQRSMAQRLDESSMHASYYRDAVRELSRQ